MGRTTRLGREDDYDGRISSATSLDRRSKRFISTRATFISIFATVIAATSLSFTLWHRRTQSLSMIPFLPERRPLNGFSALPNSMPPSRSRGPAEKELKSPVEEEPYRRNRGFDRRGVPEAMTTVRQDWTVVVNNFLDSSRPEMFSARKIREHYYTDINNVQNTCMLVCIRNGNVTFTENFSQKRHGRAESAKYIIRRIVKKKGTSMLGATFLVMLSDGHRPLVPTFGSARHWRSWNMMVPVPLGNSRGRNVEWGTPFEGWDSYIDGTVTNSHKNYTWTEKRERAVFRGSLCMQKYTLGSCNEENNGQCFRASNWSEVNRGKLYVMTREEPELFDVQFTQLKRKRDSPKSQFDNVPQTVPGMKFQDFQSFKYIINVGSNQDWAERLRSLLFMNSAVIVHQAETQEFFTPILQPWVHFIPTDLHFADLVTNVKWAREHDQFVQQIVRNQNAFADRYITERSMQQYWEVALQEFSVRQAIAAGANSGSKY